jgi:hypothetical protein
MLASRRHRAIEPPSRQSIEPASSLHRATASSQHRAFSIEHRGRGSAGDPRGWQGEGRPQSQIAFFYDRTGSTVQKDCDLEMLARLIQIVKDHYPERIGAVYIYPCGKALAGLYGRLSPLMDARMRAAMKMVSSDSELRALIPPEHVPRSRSASIRSIDARASSKERAVSGHPAVPFNGTQP